MSEYFQGDWELAHENLQIALSFKQNDAPSLKVIEFMEHHDFKAPENWNGFWDYEGGH